MAASNTDLVLIDYAQVILLSVQANYSRKYFWSGVLNLRLNAALRSLPRNILKRVSINLHLIRF